MIQRERIAVGICGALIVIGSLLPWASLGIFSVAGTKGDGVITLVPGMLIAATAFVKKGRRQTLGVIILLAGAASTWIAINVYGNLDGDTVGSGLALVFFAGLIATVMGFVGLVSKRPELPTEQSPEETGRHRADD